VSVVANVAINIDAKNAQAVLDAIKAKVKDLNGSFDQVKAKSAGAGGSLGGAFAKALGPLLTLTTAVAAFQKVTSEAFDRAGAEQRIRALSSAYGEQTQLLALASSASKKFGLTQTEASTAIADIYGRLRPLGLGLSEINSVYEGFNVVARQAGLSASESSSVFTQLAQALGSGVLRGDEFNRMAESMPGILGLVANELGVSQNALRGMAADGKITGDVVVKALQEAQKSAGDLTKYMTPAQLAMQELNRNTQEELGINFNEGGLKALGLGGLLEQVAQKTNGSTEKMVKLFGSVDALKAILPLTGDNLARFNKYLENQKKSAGQSDQAFNKMKETLNGAFKGVMTSIENLIGRLAVFAPLVVKPMTLLAQAIDLVSKNLKTVVQVSAFAAGFAAALNATAIAAALVTLRIQAIAIATKVAVVAQTALMALLGPAGWAAIAAGAAAAAIATVAKQDAATKKAVELAKINASHGTSNDIAAAAAKTASLTATISSKRSSNRRQTSH
jgi:tape measure domain-containing protein